MKYEKLLTNTFKQVTTNAIKDKAKQKIYFGEYEDKIGICIDGYAVYLVPKSICLIDTVKHGVNLDINKFITDIPDDYCKKTGVVKELINGITVKEFHNEVNDTKAYVDIKKLEYFDDHYEVRFANGKSPAFVFEDSELVGMVMPVCVRE